MADPLNPTLYRLLQRTYGYVKISNEGESMVAEYRKDGITGKPKLQVISSGEYYCVCCDHCRDTRFRLQFNHRWGVRDAMGRRNLWLVICHNEPATCYSTHDDREYLLERLTEIAGVLDKARIKPGRPVVSNGISEPPGPLYPLQTLPPDHPANAYLASRFYDPEHLGRFYRVSYCPNSYLTLARNRIIAPIFMQGVMRGWQARHIGDLPWKARDVEGRMIHPPKWWSDPRMKKRMVLYNYDNAIRYRTGVLVEGPSSAWGTGPMAMGTLGASFSDEQLRLLRPFKNGSMVLLWDPDLQDNPRTKMAWDKAMAKLKGYGFRHGVAGVILPTGTDPGTTDRTLMREIIAEQADAQHVKIDWRLK